MKLGFLGALSLVFIVLKLTEVITWSWWLVLMPLYIVPAIFLGGMVVTLLTALIIAILPDIKKK